MFFNQLICLYLILFNINYSETIGILVSFIITKVDSDLLNGIRSAQTETILRAMWNAATNADNCGFSQHPAARPCSICAILINKQLMTRGGSSTENIF